MNKCGFHICANVAMSFVLFAVMMPFTQAAAKTIPGISILIVQPGAVSQRVIFNAIEHGERRERQIIYSTDGVEKFSATKGVDKNDRIINGVSANLAQPGNGKKLTLKQISSISKSIHREYAKYRKFKKKYKEAWQAKSRQIDVKFFLADEPVRRDGSPLTIVPCLNGHKEKMDKYRYGEFKKGDKPDIKILEMAIKSLADKSMARDVAIAVAITGGWLHEDAPNLPLKVYNPVCPGEPANLKLKYNAKRFMCIGRDKKKGIAASTGNRKIGPIKCAPEAEPPAKKQALLNPAKPAAPGTPPVVVQPAQPTTTPVVSTPQPVTTTPGTPVISNPSPLPTSPIVANVPTPTIRPVVTPQPNNLQTPPSATPIIRDADSKIAPAFFNVLLSKESEVKGGVARGYEFLFALSAASGADVRLVHMSPNRSEAVEKYFDQASPSWEVRRQLAKGEHEVYAVFKPDPLKCKSNQTVQADINLHGKMLEEDDPAFVRVIRNVVRCDQILTAKIYEFNVE